MKESMSPIEEKHLTEEERLALFKKVESLTSRGGKIPSSSKTEIKNWLKEAQEIDMNTLTGTVKISDEEESLVYARAQLDFCQRDLQQKLDILTAKKN